MTVVRKPLPISVEEVFRERCEARAILCEACVFDLHEAVDVLQADAERTGLVAELGQNQVQALMAAAFARLCPADFSPDLRPPVVQPQTFFVARSTLDAAEYLIKQNDRAKFRTWLAQHTRAERQAIKKHFARQGKGRS
jgi:hypothetical protein